MKYSTPLGVFLLYFINMASSDLQLKMLHVLFRHGNKVPHKEIRNYPNDPHRNHSFLPISSGGLTKLGMMREFKIGQLLRKQYNDYFGVDYSPAYFYAQSTNSTRTKMSLQLVFAGLFTPSKTQEWNPNLPWIPIDFVFTPLEKDYLLIPYYCPEYKKEKKSVLNQPEIKKMLSKYQEVFDYLTEKTGKEIQTTKNVFELYTLLKEEAAQNLTLPNWTEEVYPNTMKNITVLEFNLQSYTKKLRRLNGGVLLRKITDDIKELQKGTLSPPERKAFFFSAHETNIAGFAKALELKEPVLPEYGSTFIVETLQDETNKYFIRVILWTGESEMYHPQTIPGCEEYCPLDEFLQIFQDIIPNDKEYYCYETDNSNALNSTAGFQCQLNLYSIILIILTYLFLITSG